MKKKLRSGVELIALERMRQITKEKYSAAHDNKHKNREIASAALSYVFHYVSRAWVFTNELSLPSVTDGPKNYRDEIPPSDWPWDDESWNPQNPLRDLVKAGALIAAEIDRLHRLQ